MVHHGAANGVAVGGSVELGNNASARHHADAVGNTEDFVEVLADEYDRRAGVAGGDQPSVHGRACPHVEPAGRAMGDNNSKACG